MEPWDVAALFDLVRSAYPFHDLSAEAFENVLRLVSGRFPTPELRDLRARVAWDRIHNRLAALPGTAHPALVGGGTIPDTGQFPVYLGEGGPRLGELDEEFVYERRVGETFVAGQLDLADRDDRAPSRGCRQGRGADRRSCRSGAGKARRARPSWARRSAALTREIADRLEDPDLLPWLEARMPARAQRPRGARCSSSRRQQRLCGAVPDDRTILIETFLDPAGELGLAVLTPFGGRLHLGAEACARGADPPSVRPDTPACLHADDGLLFRLPNMDEPPLDLFDGLDRASWRNA